MKGELKKEIGFRMQQIRKTFGWTQEKMASLFCIGRANYSRIERGDIFPNSLVLHILKTDLQISLDWMITGDGDMFRRDKSNEMANLSDFGSHMESVKDLLHHMSHVPMVLHQVLGFFLNYKERNKEVIREFFNNRESEDLESPQRAIVGQN